MTADALLSPAVVADPYPFLAALRRDEPVAWDERYRSWVVTRYDDNAALFKDPRLSSDRITPVIARELRRARPDLDLVQTLQLLDGWLVFRDPPEHGRMRRLVNKAFTVRAIAAMTDVVGRVTDDLLDQVERLAAGGAVVDLHRELAYPLPAIVIAGMLGVPPQDRDLFKGWSDDISALVFGGLEDQGRHARARDGMGELVGYMTALVARVRREPGPDLTSALVRARDQDDALSEAEVVATCVNLLFGGHETTTNLIANGVLALLRAPDQAALLAADPGTAGRAVEELLRYDGPAKAVARVAAEDVELRGRRIRAGDRVFLLPSAADRDPEVFERPDVLDLTRDPNPHLAFGAGIHYCLGAALARLEASVALPRLLQRFPALQLTGEPLHWNPVLLTRGLTGLPVRTCAPA